MADDDFMDALRELVGRPQLATSGPAPKRKDGVPCGYLVVGATAKSGAALMREYIENDLGAYYDTPFEVDPTTGVHVYANGDICLDPDNPRVHQ
jgi:hypothetical protein